MSKLKQTAICLNDELHNFIKVNGGLGLNSPIVKIVKFCQENQIPIYLIDKLLNDQLTITEEALLIKQTELKPFFRSLKNLFNKNQI